MNDTIILTAFTSIIIILLLFHCYHYVTIIFVTAISFAVN